MSSDSFARMQSKYPHHKADLERLEAYLRALGPGRTVDPSRLGTNAAQRTNVLGLLKILADHGYGRFVYVVRDNEGHAVGKYEHLRDIPDTIADEFGDTTTVHPENVHLLFEGAR